MEIFEGVVQWFDGFWCVGVEGFVWVEEVDQLFEGFEVVGLVFVLFQGVQQFYVLWQVIVVGGVLVVGFVGEEFFYVVQQGNYVDVVVYCYGQVGVYLGVDFGDVVGEYLCIQVFWEQEVGIGVVGLLGFELEVVVYVVGVVFEQFVGVDVEWQFLQVGVFYFVGEVYQFGVYVFVVGVGQGFVLVYVVVDDGWYVVQCFYVVYVGWFVLDVDGGREGWFGMWVGVVVFQ